MAVTQATYYVDPNSGNDANPGTGTGASQAFKTIERARQAVDAINGNMTGDIIVYLRGGTYWLTSPVVFGPPDSGTNGHYVYYRNYGSENPIICGGTSLVGGWTLHDSGNSIYKRTAVSGTFRQLYVNGSRAIRARTPNKNNNDTLCGYYNLVGVSTSNKTVIINKSEISNWAGLTNVEMVMNPHWYHNRGRISSYTTGTTNAVVSFQAPENNLMFAKGDAFWSVTPYFFENAYAFLDAPGEWFLDAAANILYYKPRTSENMPPTSVIAPALDTLIQINGTSPTAKVSCIQFEGITFSYANWNGPTDNGSVMTQGARELVTDDRPGAIIVKYASSVHFDSCTFKFLGGSAVSYPRGVTDSSIGACSFIDLAGNGIVVHDDGTSNPATGNKCDKISIVNNDFTRVGQDYSNGIPVISYFPKRLLIAANEISYCPYMGIQTGGQTGADVEAGMKDNVIRHNYIHDVMQLHDDGGAIYTLSKQQGTFVFENHVNNLIATGTTGTWPVAGLYADGYTQFVTFEHNATVNCSGTYEQVGAGAKNNNWLNHVLTADASITAYAGLKATYIWPLRLEAESMMLANYTVESGSFYSNDSGGLKTAAGTTGVARSNFAGASGTYSIDTAYIAEDDGNAVYRLYVGGTSVATWTAYAAPTGTGAQIRHKVIHGVAINAGQEIKIEGDQISGSHARLDYLEFYTH